MTWLSPRERRIRARRWAVAIALGVAVVAALTLVDRPVYALFVVEKSRVESRDWYQMLRQVGYWPTWALLGLAVTLGASRTPTRPGRWSLAGPWLPVSAGIGGILAEALKLLIGRERPGPGGEHVFKPLFGAFTDPHRLGLPSSHAACAFGGALLVWYASPRTGLVALAAATGCAVTRLLTGAHFLSDTVGGALIALAVARTIAGRIGVLPPRRAA